MNELIKAAGSTGESFADFHAYKETFDNVLKRTADDFVRIGYLLKYARDTEILKESSYDSLVDFAKGEYGLDKTQVSRFISINDRFSKGGYGDTLEDKYGGYGYAKLSVMLTLPEEVTEDLSPEMTKAEIVELKKEVDEEAKISDVEVLLEEKEEPAAELSEFGLLIRELVRTNPKLYLRLHKIFVSGEMLKLPETFAPNGKDIYIVRIAGIGKFTITAELAAGFSIVNLRSLEKSSVCWKEITDELVKWFYVDRSAEESWKTCFDTELPGENVTKPAENDIKPQKTAENCKKEVKTDENKPNPVKSEPKKAEKKPSRIHKPEKVEEKETERPAPKEETPTVVTCHATEEQVEELKKIMSEPAAGFMPEPVEEIEPGTLGHLEVVKNEVAPVQQDRIIEVREEIDLERFKIDASADIKTQIQQVDLVIQDRLKKMNHHALMIREFFKHNPADKVEFSAHAPAVRKDWVDDFADRARGIEEAAHDVELLNDYLRELELREDE